MSGSLTPLSLYGGPDLYLDASSRADLGGAYLHQQPDATPDELRVWLAALGGSAMNSATTGRAVQHMDWR